MWDSGNLQQQPLMMNFGSSARQLMVCLIVGSVLVTSACTRLPVEQGQAKSVQVSTGKIQLVGQTLVGTTTRYVDSASGATVEISVLSEYFSAGGRKCRRFSQSTGAPLSGSGQVPASWQDSGTSSAVSNSVLLTKNTGSVVTTKGLACEDDSKGWIEIPLNSIAG